MALTKLNFGGSQTALVASNIPTLTSASMPTNSIIQAKQVTSSGIIINNQSSTQHSGLTVTLTPTSTSNRLVISYSSTLYVASSAQLWNSIYVNDAEVTLLQHQSYFTSEARRDVGGYFVYTPTNTNSTTFKYYISRGSGTYYLGANGEQNSFMVQEIKG
jgi:hypothetical protein